MKGSQEYYESKREKYDAFALSDRSKFIEKITKKQDKVKMWSAVVKAMENANAYRQVLRDDEEKYIDVVKKLSGVCHTKKTMMHDVAVERMITEALFQSPLIWSPARCKVLF